MTLIKSNSIDEYIVIINKKTTLYFNGYSTSSNKNSLSKTHFISFIRNKRSDKEILKLIFKNHTKKINDKLYIYNHIVNKNSWIISDLKKHYKDLNYLPLEDFTVVKDPTKRYKI